MPAPNVFDDVHENFTVRQFFTPCLAEMAYLIMSEGVAAIIDPLREIEPYLKLLEDNKLTLKYIFLTHFHADFVSGHYDLSQKTGAEIVFGPTAKSSISIITAVDEQVF
jgi:glyoxylase-like metal-dependent hydrolase (beta-lactamase superfamily II)